LGKEAGRVLLEVKSLKKYYPIEKGFMRKVIGQVKAVDDISLYVNENETLGLVGESGCGKTTLGRCILRAIEPTDGKVYLHLEKDQPIDFTALDKKGLRETRKHMQMIFQNPYSSLNPRMTIFDIVAEPMRLAGITDEDHIVSQVKRLVDLVGLEIKHLNRYPFAFSGGQRQRIGIARSLALNPCFIVADESVSALDVSIRAQILNLLQDLQDELKLTYLFIAHDLSVIEHISDRVCVMYLGRLVELAETEKLFKHPRNPYTEALIAAIPLPDPENEKKPLLLPGEVASAADLPGGCCFHPRCRYLQERCQQEAPVLQEITPGHFVACHRAAELDLTGVVSLQAAPGRA
jgi:oligopeptide/dipeptide ABC transporter ATP-binding protein